MATQAKLSDYGISVGTLPSGPLGKISDVPGVTVGHCTVDTQTQKTGVTVVMPCADDMFAQKLPAAACVLNGFGKTAGLVQIGELGTLETPIALTNTLNVGLVYDAMVEYMVGRCAQSGTALRSVNPVVAECNDGGLNDIARRAVRQEHVFAAIENARADFEEGDVGAGKGMVCHGLKGGIGSASRLWSWTARVIPWACWRLQTTAGWRICASAGKASAPKSRRIWKARRNSSRTRAAVLL